MNKKQKAINPLPVEQFVMLPCPFCGKHPVIAQEPHYDWYVIKCHNENCPAVTVEAFARYKNIAIKRWNTRI